MKYVVYLDVFFLVNLVMDLIILKLAALYIKPQTTFARCLLGAICGSLLSIFSLSISYENMIIHMLFSYIFITFIMVLVSYGKSSLKQTLIRSAILYLVTIFLGGMFNFIYSFTYFGYILQSIFNGFLSSVNMIWMLGATFVSYIILNMMNLIWRRSRSGSMLVWVIINLDGRSKSIKGLIDSGNSLTDPYTGKNVHIVTIDSIKELFDGVSVYDKGFKLIPFRSLGENNGLIKAITFDEILVYREDEKIQGTKEEIYVEKLPIIGLYNGCLSKKGEYEMLLHKSVNL